MKQGNTFQEMIKPLLVLVIICLVVSALLRLWRRHLDA